MIPFEFKQGLLFIPVYAEHIRQKAWLRAIIDTGSAGSAIDINIVRPSF